MGSKKKVGLERQQPEDEEDDDTIKARFQEIGPRMTVKMRWIRRGGLGETGDERKEREKMEKEEGTPEFGEFGEVGEGEDPELGEVGGQGGKKGEKRQQEEDEKIAAKEIGLDEEDETSQPNFDFAGAAAAAEAEAAGLPPPSTTTDSLPKKRSRTTPRKRSKPYHALLRPPPSPSPEPGAIMESEPIPLPPKNGKKKDPSQASLLSTVGKTWHAGKGEGGVREARKRSEWGWEVSLSSFFCVLRSTERMLTGFLFPSLVAQAKMQVSRRKFFL